MLSAILFRLTAGLSPFGRILACAPLVLACGSSFGQKPSTFCQTQRGFWIYAITIQILLTLLR